MDKQQGSHFISRIHLYAHTNENDKIGAKKQGDDGRVPPSPDALLFLFLRPLKPGLWDFSLIQQLCENQLEIQ